MFVSGWRKDVPLHSGLSVLGPRRRNAGGVRVERDVGPVGPLHLPRGRKDVRLGQSGEKAKCPLKILSLLGL